MCTGGSQKCIDGPHSVKYSVITFTGKLFGMFPYEAAKKLITDFNLPIPLKEQKSVQNKFRDREGKKVQSR